MATVISLARCISRLSLTSPSSSVEQLARTQLELLSEDRVMHARPATGRLILSSSRPIQGTSDILTTLYNFVGSSLPWYNFAHPGDLIAYPIEKLMPNMLGPGAQYVSIQDFLVTDAGPQFMDNFDPYAILRAGDAHQAYWKSNLVAEHIAQAIKIAQ